MRLYLQNAIVFVSIFLGMFLIMGLSAFFTRRDEILWGFKDELASLAISMAEFVKPTDLPRLETGSEQEVPLAPRLQMSLDRLFASGLVRHLAIYSGDGERIIYSQGEEPVWPVPSFLKESIPELKTIVIGQKQIHNAWDYLVIGDYRKGTGENDPDTMAALAPVSDGRGKLAAMVLVEKDVSQISEQSKKTISQFLIAGVLIVVVGLLTASIVTSMIKKPILKLNQTILASVKGQWNPGIEENRIREFYDFSNTYNTMLSVLEEAEARFNRILVQREHYFTREQLTCYFHANSFQPLTLRQGPLTAAGRLHGETARDFFDLGPHERGLWAVVCRLGPLEGDTVELISSCECDLKLAVASISVAELIRNELALADPRQAYQKVSGLYEIEYFHYAFFDRENGLGTSWKRDPDTQDFEKTEWAIQDGSSYVLHTFTGEAAQQIETYTRYFGGLEPEKRMNEILNALSDHHRGALVIVNWNPG